MIAASFVFLTPRGALLSLGGLVPLLALALATRRASRVRDALGLPPAGRGSSARPALAVIAVACLLGLTATQPVLRSTAAVDIRTDAQVLFVVDSSRSMLASRAPGARSRIARARDDALRLRDDLIDLPAGVATITDHVLPDLLPVADRDVFDETVRRSARVGNPPPATASVTATNLGALGAIGTQSFFPPSARRRVAIVLTDGESAPFDLRGTARQLGQGPGVIPIFVHVWNRDERVFDPNGDAESAYHSDPSSAATLDALAQATGGKVFGEGRLAAAAAAARAAVGSGPSRPEAVTASTTALAPYVALAALVPLLVLLVEGGVAPRIRRRAVSRRAAVAH